MKIFNTRQIILNVAKNVFARFGYQKTTVDDIAHNAHKAKGSIYYYFKNKDELYKCVIENELDQVKKELNKVIEQNSNSGISLMQYITTRMKMMSKAVNYHQFINNSYLQHIDFLSSVRKNFENFEIVSLRKLLNQGVEKKEFLIKDIDLAVDAFLVTLRGLDFSLLINNRYKDFEKRLDEIIYVVIRGLRLGTQIDNQYSHVY